jgi:UDP-glucose 4-epimerase
MNAENVQHRILITGGAGFIGAHLVRELSQTPGYTIAVIDNESLGRHTALEDYDVDFTAGDILDVKTVEAVMRDVCTVVHFAADTRVMDSIENPSHNFRTNVEGTFNLLTAARAAGVKRFINASTGGAILGEQTPPINEDMTPQPSAPYGASKLAAEGYCSAFSGAYGLNTVSLRFSNIYGPGSLHKGSVVAHFLKQILDGQNLTIYGDGGQTRDYLFVEDLVAGIVKFIETEATGVYQLGTGIPTTLNELIDIIRSVVGDAYSFDVSYENFRDGEISHTWCDISKAQAEIGFDPETVLPAGIERTWSWFLNQKYNSNI